MAADAIMNIAKERISTFANIENGHFKLHAKFRLDILNRFGGMAV